MNADHNGPPAADSRDVATHHRGPRTGPIVWGTLVLAFCAFTMVQTVAPGSLNGTTFLIAATIGLGVVLLAVSAVTIARNARAVRADRAAARRSDPVGDADPVQRHLD